MDTRAGERTWQTPLSGDPSNVGNCTCRQEMVMYARLEAIQASTGCRKDASKPGEHRQQDTWRYMARETSWKR